MGLRACWQRDKETRDQILPKVRVVIVRGWWECGGGSGGCTAAAVKSMKQPRRRTPLGCAPRTPGGATCIASGAVIPTTRRSLDGRPQRHGKSSFSDGYNDDNIEPSPPSFDYIIISQTHAIAPRCRAMVPACIYLSIKNLKYTFPPF